jgi:hypothetical protein
MNLTHGATLAACLDALIAEHGTLRAVARSAKIDVGYLSRLHRGEKTEPSSGTLAVLGIQRHVIYTLARGVDRSEGGS